MAATYQELMSQKAALEKQAAALQEQIENAHRSEHTEAVARIRALMQEYGVSLAELGSGGGKGKVPAKRPGKSASSGKKVAAKYRNAATGDSWSGRGLKPNWLKAALASGKRIEDFAV